MFPQRQHFKRYLCPTIDRCDRPYCPFQHVRIDETFSSNRGALEKGLSSSLKKRKGGPVGGLTTGGVDQKLPIDRDKLNAPDRPVDKLRRISESGGNDLEGNEMSMSTSQLLPCGSSEQTKSFVRNETVGSMSLNTKKPHIQSTNLLAPTNQLLSSSENPSLTTQSTIDKSTIRPIHSSSKQVAPTTATLPRTTPVNNTTHTKTQAQPVNLMVKPPNNFVVGAKPSIKLDINSYTSLKYRQQILDMLYTQFVRIYANFLAVNPALAFVDALRQEEWIYGKSTKATYRSTACTTLNGLKKRAIASLAEELGIDSEFREYEKSKLSSEKMAVIAPNQKPSGRALLTLDNLRPFFATNEALRENGYPIGFAQQNDQDLVNYFAAPPRHQIFGQTDGV